MNVRLLKSIWESSAKLRKVLQMGKKASKKVHYIKNNAYLCSKN